MMIQLLTYSGKENDLKGKYVTINKLHDAQSFDEFDINIIDLRDNNIWKNYDNTKSTINILNDFESLSIIINSKKRAHVVILLPQNINYYYCTNYEGIYRYSCELKNMIDSLKGYILKSLYTPMNRINLTYENTKTMIGNEEVSASFHFNQVEGNSLTNSIRSNKVTTIKCNDIILSTLNIVSYEQLINFLRQIHLIEEKEEVPDWIKEEKMFDDAKQLEIIEENNHIIKDANIKIDKATEIMRKNERYKSILYTSGKELEDIVIEIVKEMLGCDLSQFYDEKKEDFNFILNDRVFIGEIKGITSNVRSGNVSQLDVHVQNYLDDHEKDNENITALLIIDHQRNRPLSEREPVHDTQINLAKRNGSLIIETITLLKMFEKYLRDTLTREKCIEILISNTGLLTVDKFN